MAEEMTRRTFLLDRVLPSIFHLATRGLPDLATSSIPRKKEPKGLFPLSERIKLLDDSAFFTPSILVGQNDDLQYANLEGKEKTNLKLTKKLSCGWAVIATILNAHYCLNGEETRVTIGDVMNSIAHTRVDMEDREANTALKILGRKTGLFTVVDDLMPFWAPDHTEIIARSRWEGIFQLAQQRVIGLGGLLVARVLKYGNRPIVKQTDVQAHFIGISGGRQLILDTKGNQGLGAVITTSLADYTQEFNGQEGFLHIQGVIPTTNIVSKHDRD